MCERDWKCVKETENAWESLNMRYRDWKCVKETDNIKRDQKCVNETLNAWERLKVRERKMKMGERDWKCVEEAKNSWKRLKVSCRKLFFRYPTVLSSAKRFASYPTPWNKSLGNFQMCLWPCPWLFPPRTVHFIPLVPPSSNPKSSSRTDAHICFDVPNPLDTVFCIAECIARIMSRAVASPTLLPSRMLIRFLSVRMTTFVTAARDRLSVLGAILNP